MQREERGMEDVVASRMKFVQDLIASCVFEVSRMKEPSAIN